MALRRFPLRAGGRPRVEISWRGNWDDVHVEIDGTLVGTLTRDEALKGKSFRLRGKSKLRVQVVQNIGLPDELRVTRDGAFLPGSSGDPRQAIHAAFVAILFIGIVNVIAGAGGFAMVTNAGIGAVVEGIAFIALAIVFRQRRSSIALLLAVVLGLVDAILVVYAAVANGRFSAFFLGGLTVRGLLLALIFAGFRGLRDAKGMRGKMR